MNATPYRRNRTPALVAGAALLALAACADHAPLAPGQGRALRAAPATLPASASFNTALAELRRATARYHDVAAAVADGFVQVGECEERDGDQGEAGIPFVNLERVLDGVIDLSRPEGLLYEPGTNGALSLVGVELVIPYPLWTAPGAPEFFGAQFQREDEFGVFGLHVWVWRHNPNGPLAILNPRVSCEAAS